MSEAIQAFWREMGAASHIVAVICGFILGHWSAKK
jgi:hypothetical protein